MPTLPFITDVSPAEGSPSGGAVVTLTGTDFGGLTAVKFASEYATDIDILDPTTATCTVPARPGGSAGTVKVHYGLNITSPKIDTAWSVSNATSFSWNVTVREDGNGDDITFRVIASMQGGPGATPAYVDFGLIPDCAPGGVINPALAGVKGVYLSISGPNQIYGARSGQPTPNPYATADGAAVSFESIGKSSGLVRVPYEWEIDTTYRLTLIRGDAVTVSGTDCYEWGLTIANLDTGVALDGYAVVTLRAAQGNLATSSIKVSPYGLYASSSAALRGHSAAEYTLFRVNGSVAPTSLTPVVQTPYSTSTAVTDGYRLDDAIPTLDYAEFEYVVYTGPEPTVTNLSPDHGDSTGGTSVVITGTNFVDVTSVSFGPYPAASYVVDSATQITAVTPNVGLATVPNLGVVVSTADGGPSAATTEYDFDGIVIPTDLVDVDYEITQPTADPTGGLLHKVLIKCTTEATLPPSDGGLMRVAATVPAALLAGSGASALSWRSRTVTAGVPGVWSASTNIGTTRVATRDYTTWATNQEQQIELSFIATTLEDNYDIAVLVTYVVEG